MIGQFVDKLLNVPLEDPDEQRRSLLFNILTLGLISLVFIAVVLTIFLPEAETLDKSRLTIAGSALLGGLVIVFIIGRYWSVRQASWLLLGILTISMALADTPQEVVSGRVLYMFTIPIFMASVLLRPYSGFIVAGFVGLLINYVALTSSFPINFVAPIGFLAVALVSWLSARSLEQALKDLRAVNEELEAQSAALAATNTRLQEEIAEHQRTEVALVRQAQALARSNKELQQFAYVASHDLREPLRKVRSYTELLQRRYQGQIDEKADKYIGYIVGGATRMQTLITDLLSYSQVGKEEALSLTSLDLNETLSQTLVDMERTIQESQAAIAHDPLPTIVADPSQMAQLFQNLLSNALKFRGEGPPRVHITAEPKNDRWLFAFRDNGIGIEPQYAERVFVIFQRLHTREEYPGTGIGLAICKKIVENHNGRIWLESELGQGSTFYFTLPVRQNGGDVIDEPLEQERIQHASETH